MIILLTGPTGSGKTDTSWALLSITKNMVFLDCDWFASLLPFSWEKESDVHMVYQALARMIQFYEAQGHANFVITLTSQMAALYQKYGDCLYLKSMPTYAFRLRCHEDELKKRIMLRDRIDEQKRQELIHSLKQQTFFDANFPNDKIFIRVDGMHISEQEVAAYVLNIVKENENKL